MKVSTLLITLRGRGVRGTYSSLRNRRYLKKWKVLENFLTFVTKKPVYPIIRIKMEKSLSQKIYLK